MVASYVKRDGRAKEKTECQDDTRRAICVLDPQPGHKAAGVVYFEQPHFYSKCKISG